ncbi:MAG: hypothetical protein KDA42_04600 [Planctomycetales bacterium]|nr:hypothetical protein [Planctomycetales bacterium]
MPISRTILAILLVLALLLPVTQGVLFWVANLLAGMDDTSGAAFTQRLSLAIGVFWMLDLIVLVLAMAVNSLSQREPPG